MPEAFGTVTVGGVAPGVRRRDDEALKRDHTGAARCRRWLRLSRREWSLLSGDRFEILLRPFPQVDGLRETISIDGGRYPRWGRNGQELFYVNLNGAMMAVPVTLSPELKIGTPAKLFGWSRPPNVITARPYDISPIDGRFLISRAVSASALPPINISVVINWFAELRTLLPR